MNSPSTTRYFDWPAHITVERARNGDPQALRTILEELATYLREEKAIPQPYRLYITDWCEKLTSSKALSDSKLDLSGHDEPSLATHTGPRLSKDVQRSIGRAFCRATGLARAQGGAVPHTLAAIPTEISKLEELRLWGASRRLAIEIVHSAHPTRTKRWLDEWLRQSGSSQPKPGTVAGNEKDHRKFLLATRVEHRVTNGESLDQACVAIAREIVEEVLKPARPRKFLRPQTVNEAYEFAVAVRSQERN